MGICNSKNIFLDDYEINNNINIADNIINLYSLSINCQYLDSAINLYEYELMKNNNMELDYVTKCIILANFIRDIDKLLFSNGKFSNSKLSNSKLSNKSDDYIKNNLIKLKIPIFVIELLDDYRNNRINKNIIMMKKFDILDNISNKKFDEKINIIKFLIESTHII